MRHRSLAQSYAVVVGVGPGSLSAQHKLLTAELWAALDWKLLRKITALGFSSRNTETILPHRVLMLK